MFDFAQWSGASAGELAAAALAAFLGSVLGGLSGQGVGLLLPVFLAPIVGIANVVPVMSIAALMTNLSRLAVFWREIRRAEALRVLIGAIPGALAGAIVFTWMDARLASIALGGFLVLSVPLRLLLARARYRLSGGGLSFAGGGYGVLAGGMTGTGLMLLSVLMAAGVQGGALIATDATVSTVINILKMAVFGGAGLFNPGLLLSGVLIGLCTTPGAFVARWLLRRIALRIHTLFMDALVLGGGITLLWRAWSTT